MQASASSANQTDSDLCQISDKEVAKSCKALWKSAPILYSLVPLFENKDAETKEAVKKLLEVFKLSHDKYTRDIWTYFWYLVWMSSSNSEDENSEENNNQNEENNNQDNNQNNNEWNNQNSNESTSSNEENNSQNNNQTTGNWYISIGSISSNNDLIIWWVSTKILSFPITVKNKKYALSSLTLNFDSNINNEVIKELKLNIDGFNVWTVKITSNKAVFSFYKALDIWKHNFEINWIFKVNNNANWNKLLLKDMIIDEWKDWFLKELKITKIISNSYSQDTNSTPSVNATTNIISSSMGNKIIKPWIATEIASFAYMVKNNSIDINNIVFKVENLRSTDIDNIDIDFWWSIGTPALSFKYLDNSHIIINFNNTIKIPEGKYNVNVYATFNESAIKAWLNEAKKITKVAIDPTAPTNDWTWDKTNTKWFSSLSYNHFIAKAFPELSVKDKNTNSENPRLDIRIIKSNDDENTLHVTSIWGTPNSVWTDTETSWVVAEWGESDLSKINIDANYATVIRTRSRRAAITSISFTVIDDEWKIATYNDVNADSIADFASLTL